MAAADTERLEGLDFMRGIAVMGIALMNVASFALPPGAYDNPAAYGSPSRLDLFVWAIEFVFVDGKLRALFSILFGASLVLMLDREETRGGNPLALHVRRMGVLLLIGIGHALLVWPGDILVSYAVVGLIAVAFRERPTAALLVAASLCLIGQMLVSGATLSAMIALRDAAAVPDAGAAIAAWRDLLGEIGRNDSAARQAVALHGGGYADILADRLAEARAVRGAQLLVAGPETLGFMLIGMAALRSGALAGRWPRRDYRRIACVAIGLGGIGGAGLVVLCAARGFDPVAVYAAALIGGAPLRPLIAIGYAALCLLVRQGPLAARIRAVGRMALSCYVGTSIVFALLFDGYGLGLFGRLSRAALLLPVLAVWAAMLLLCPLWMRRFRHGPLEWLWRCAASGQIRSLRRRFTIET